MVDVNVEPFEIEVRTRHDDLVRADVYLPAQTADRVPVLLGASPYLKALRWLPPNPAAYPFIEYGPIQLYLDEGYAYVAMDLPGTGRSDGRWDPVSREEGEAIHDMIEHIALQAWAGRIGMIGMSYYCWSQWNAARTRPPSLSCIAAFDGATDMYRDWMYTGGIATHQFLQSWLFSVLLHHQQQGLSLTDNGRGDFVYDVYRHRFDDDWQRRRSPFWELDQVEIPVMSIASLGKPGLHLRGNFEGFRRVRGPRQLLVVDPPSFGATQQLFFDETFHRAELLPWYDHHLKGMENGVMARAAVRYASRGEAEGLRCAEDWPPPDAVQAAFFLGSEASGTQHSLNDGSLLEAQPDRDDDQTRWHYPDPAWTAGVSTIGADGQPDHFARVVTYTTAAFTRRREFTGQGVLELFASTDQRDMDVMVKLSLLPASGKPAFVKVTQGWLRASHRAEDPVETQDMRPFHIHRSAEPTDPGVIYLLRVELLPFSFMVSPGDRLRLEISNWDSWITETPMTHWFSAKVGCDTYHHDRGHPSRLRLHERPLTD